MSELLEKSRKINRLLQRTGGQRVDFSEMADVLNDAVDSNIFISSQKGKILGNSLLQDFECDFLEEEIIEAKNSPF